MKTPKILPLILLLLMGTQFTSRALVPSGCRPVVDGVAVETLTLELLTKWCDGSPLVVQCDDGNKYTLKSFQVNFFTMKPLMNREFGIGEGGIPIKAREAVSAGAVGDALVLKEVSATGPKGETVTFAVLSFKIK